MPLRRASRHLAASSKTRRYAKSIPRSRTLPRLSAIDCLLWDPEGPGIGILLATGHSANPAPPESSEARRRAEDVRRSNEDFRRWAENVRRRAEDFRGHTEEFHRRAKHLRRIVEDVRRGAEDLRRTVEDVRRSIQTTWRIVKDDRCIAENVDRICENVEGSVENVRREIEDVGRETSDIRRRVGDVHREMGDVQRKMDEVARIMRGYALNDVGPLSTRVCLLLAEDAGLPPGPSRQVLEEYSLRLREDAEHMRSPEGAKVLELVERTREREIDVEEEPPSTEEYVTDLLRRLLTCDEGLRLDLGAGAHLASTSISPALDALLHRLGDNVHPHLQRLADSDPTGAPTTPEQMQRYPSLARPTVP